MAKRKITPNKAKKVPHNPDQEKYLEVWCPLTDWELELLAIIIRKDYVYPKGVNFITDPNEVIQVGTIRTNLPSKVKPHKHRHCSRTTHRTQEVLFIKRGLVLLDLYSSSSKFYKQVWLQEGDTAVLLNGGHGLTLEGQCDILEVKNGPYVDRASDKEDIGHAYYDG